MNSKAGQLTSPYKTVPNKTRHKDLGGNKNTIRTDGSFEKVRFKKNNKGVDYMPYGSNRIIRFFGWWLEFFRT